MSEYESLLWEVDGAVATLTLNRPEKKNAMSWTMFHELGDAFIRAGDEPEVRVLIVTGAGDAFSSGADLGDPENMVTTPFEMRDRMATIHRVAEAIARCRVPTIAKVTGIAAGAGCNLAFACDMIVASTEAAFAELFVKRGLVVDFGGSWALTRLLPLNKAKELALLGDTIDAREADRLGLLNRLCEPEAVDGVVNDMARKAAAMPPRTVALIKDNLNRAGERSIEESLDAESAAQALCMSSEDTKEALMAFLEKREPRFTGR